MRQPTVVDFESDAIQERPHYPPKDCGVAILKPGQPPEYEAYGHPINNGLYRLKTVRGEPKAVKIAEPSRERAQKKLRDAWRGPLLFHNSKFDLDVAEQHMGLKLPPWDQIHDTMFRLFLKDPHAATLSLKPNAEKYLGMPPEERDAIADWLREHKIIQHNEEPGAHISKVPGDIVALYAIGDVVRTKGLHECKRLSLDRRETEAYDRERHVMPIFLRNEQEGLRLDVDTLERDLKVYEAAIVKCEAWLRKKLKCKGLNFDNAVEVGDALFKTKIVVDWVWTKGGKNRAPQRSVAKDNLGPERFKDPSVAAALGYRTRLHTVLANSMRPWLAQATKDGRIYTSINQVRHHEAGKAKGARTGRVSASRFMNVTKNFLNKGDGYVHPAKLGLPELPLVRNYILPDKGTMWDHRDVRQEEFRVTAHYEDGPLAERYRKDPCQRICTCGKGCEGFDVHNFCREVISSLGLEELSHVDRVIIKNFTHGILYGEGGDLLAVRSGMERSLAHKLKGLIWQALPGVRELNDELKRMGRAGEPIRTWGGRIYYCEPPGYSKKFKREMTYEYKLLNYVAQGSSADLGKEAIIRYDEVKHSDARMLIFIHDEINIQTPPKLLESEDRKLRDAIEKMEGWDVPMLTDRKVGKLNTPWGKLEKVKRAT